MNKRPIKFRVYHKVDGMKYFGDLPIHILLNGDICFDEVNENYKVDSYKLMQFTGLQDKNGKEIYEGDIVKSIRNEQNPDTYNYDKVEKISFIEYRENGFWVKDEYYGNEGEGLWEWGEMEVIGNINEHTELLK